MLLTATGSGRSPLAPQQQQTNDTGTHQRQGAGLGDSHQRNLIAAEIVVLDTLAGGGHRLRAKRAGQRAAVGGKHIRHTRCLRAAHVKGNRAATQCEITNTDLDLVHGVISQGNRQGAVIGQRQAAGAEGHRAARSDGAVGGSVANNRSTALQRLSHAQRQSGGADIEKRARRHIDGRGIANRATRS